MQVTGRMTKNTVACNDTKHFGEEIHFLPVAGNLPMILSGSACSQATMPPYQLCYLGSCRCDVKRNNILSATVMC